MRFPALFLLVLFLSWSTTSWSQELGANDHGAIEIRLHVAVKYHHGNTNFIQDWQFPVICTVASNSWRIDEHYIQNGTRSTYFDGSCLYQRIGSDPDTAKRLAMEVDFSLADSNMPPTVSVRLSEGRCAGDLGVNIPWLAFCSSDYLKLPGRVIPLPVVDTYSDIETFAYADVTEMFEGLTPLPRHVQFFTSKKTCEKGVFDQRLLRTRAVLRARANPAFVYPDGMLRFEYKVQAWTNFANRTIPTEFTFQENRPSASGEWKPQISGIGQVKTILFAAPPNNVLLSDTNQVVSDARFVQDRFMLDSILYPWPAAAIPPTNDAVVTKVFHETLARAKPVTP